MVSSYDKPPSSVTLDIDDTCDIAHGHQQLSLFNAHYDERCFLPIHICDTEQSRPVAMILHPGKTPSGVEVRAHLRRPVRHIRERWPATRIPFRGDGHYARPQTMAWCEDHGVDYVFCLPGTKPLSKKVEETADAVPVERAFNDKDVVRGYPETRHRAISWDRARRAIARIEATGSGSTSASPSPILRTARRNGSTTASIVRAGRRKTSSSSIRRSFAPIDPHAVRRAPIRFASSCTQRPIG